jgi:hypothetical protein
VPAATVEVQARVAAAAPPPPQLSSPEKQAQLSSFRSQKALECSYFFTIPA